MLQTNMKHSAASPQTSSNTYNRHGTNPNPFPQWRDFPELCDPGSMASTVGMLEQLNTSYDTAPKCCHIYPYFKYKPFWNQRVFLGITVLCHYRNGILLVWRPSVVFADLCRFIPDPGLHERPRLLKGDLLPFRNPKYTFTMPIVKLSGICLNVLNHTFYYLEHNSKPCPNKHLSAVACSET